MFVALAVAGLLGAVYYGTAPRTYRATASLMVLHSGGEVWDPSLAPNNGQEDLIPTLEKLFLQSVIVDGAIKRIRVLPAEQRIDYASYPPQEWPRILREGLSVRGVRQTRLIELGYCSRRVDAAEAVLAAVLDTYLEFVERTHRDVSVEIVNILDRERVHVARDLAEKQSQFRDLSLRTESLGLRGHETIAHPVVARVVELNDTLMRVRKDRLQLQTSLAAIEAARRNSADLRPHLISLEPIVGRELVLGAMGLDDASREAGHRVVEALIEDRARLAALLDHYGERHPEISELRQEIAFAEQFLSRQTANQHGAGAASGNAPLGEMLVSLVNGRLAELVPYEDELQRQYAEAAREAGALEDRMVELSLIEHDIELLRNLHDTLANRIADLGIRQNRSDVRLATVSEPAAHAEPVSPRLSLVSAGCVLAGLASGLLWIYVADLLDDRFRTAQEIGDQLGLPVLGTIWKLPAAPAVGISAIHVHTAPRSVESEAFHTLRTMLSLASDDRRRIAIMSSEPGDGKTTVLVNLAVSITRTGKRVLLIDADLRRQGLRRLFDMNAPVGLCGILRSQDDLAVCSPKYIVPAGIDRLDLLPGGPIPADPTELLSRPRFADLIGWAETLYDYVLIDCPPVPVASDAAIVGRAVDNVLLLVRPDKNHRRVVLHVVELLQNMQIRIAGVVLNQIESADEGYDYGSYYCGYGTDGDMDVSAGEERELRTDTAESAPKQSRAA